MIPEVIDASVGIFGSYLPSSCLAICTPLSCCVSLVCVRYGPPGRDSDRRGDYDRPSYPYDGPGAPPGAEPPYGGPPRGGPPGPPPYGGEYANGGPRGQPPPPPPPRDANDFSRGPPPADRHLYNAHGNEHARTNGGELLSQGRRDQGAVWKSKVTPGGQAPVQRTRQRARAYQRR